MTRAFLALQCSGSLREGTRFRVIEAADALLERDSTPSNRTMVCVGPTLLSDTRHSFWSGQDSIKSQRTAN